MQHEKNFAVGALAENLELGKVLDARLLRPLSLNLSYYVLVILIALLK